ncbi:MAG: hypothetical protein JWP23_219 [Phenylobacterium sp.]|nr:hypothetical protein [Phenylobacterium sp.]
MNLVLHWALLGLKFIGLMVVGLIYSVAFVCAMAFVYWLITWFAERIVGRKREPAGSDTPRLRGLMKRMARQTLLLALTKEPAFSKLGGEPELPEGLAWPEGVKEPRAFLAQIDLAEVRASDGPEWLPAEGQLYAFYDDWRAGFADEVRILSSLETPGAPVAPASTLAMKWRFQERRAAFLPFRSIPSLDWLGVNLMDLDVSDEELDELSSAPDKPFGDELQHRIGGYPSEIQNGQMRLECEYLARGLEAEAGPPPPAILRASRTWLLLLQIESDPGLKMSWGDAGRLYVFVREADSQKGDFSKTVTISQTH